MARVFVNGVSNFSSDSKTVSFAFDDTHHNGAGLVQKNIVFEIICDIEAAEGMLSYLLQQVKNVKDKNLLTTDTSNKKEAKITDKKNKQSLGRKLGVSSDEHL